MFVDSVLFQVAEYDDGFNVDITQYGNILNALC